MGTQEEMRSTELESIQKKILGGKERNVSGVELIGYILGSCDEGESDVAFAVDLLSYFGGWDGLFQATRSELEELKQLKINQIDMILAISNLRKMMKTKEN